MRDRRPLLLPLLLLPGLAAAQSQEAHPGIEACASIEIDATRLACYDQAVQREARATSDADAAASAASAGAILVTRLMVRGVAGVVADGGFRDSPEIGGLAIPAYHNRPSAPTNLTLHQAIDLNVPIGCGDVAVYPGDIIVGDGDGNAALVSNEPSTTVAGNRLSWPTNEATNPVAGLL